MLCYVITEDAFTFIGVLWACVLLLILILLFAATYCYVL